MSQRPSHLLKKKERSLCSLSTRVAPKVDFLFLWDNTTSSRFINPETAKALKNTINLISPRFDYHIVLAPLKHQERTNSSEFFLITENTKGLNDEAISKIIPADDSKRIELFNTFF